MLIYGWYCSVKTFPKTNKYPGAPAIEISQSVFDKVTKFLSSAQTSGENSYNQNTLQYACKMFSELVTTNSFVFSFEMGSKNIELTQRLHPKPVKPQFDVYEAGQWLEEMCERQFTIDTQELLDRLNSFKATILLK